MGYDTGMTVTVDKNWWPKGEKIEAAISVVNGLYPLLDDDMWACPVSVIAGEMMIAHPPTHYIDLIGGEGAVESWVFEVGGDTLVASCGFASALWRTYEPAKHLTRRGAEAQLASVKVMQSELAKMEAQIIQDMTDCDANNGYARED